MMKRYLFIAALAVLPIAGMAQPESFALNWAVTGTDMGVTTGDFRGVFVDPTTGNVVVSEDDANEVHILNPADGSVISTIINADTGDGTVDPYKVSVSDDGQIFTQGFGGSVKRLGNASTTDASSGVLVVDRNTDYVTTTTGSSRTMNIFGDHAAGTATLFVGRGTDITVFQNSAATPDEYTEVAVITVPTVTFSPPEVEGVFANSSLTSVWTHQLGGSPATRRFDGSIGGGFTENTAGSGFFNFEFGIHLDFTNDVLIAGGGHGSSNEIRFTAETISGAAPIGPGAAVGPNPIATPIGGLYSWGSTGIANNATGDVAIDVANNRYYVTGAGQSAATGAVLRWDPAGAPPPPTGGEVRTYTVNFTSTPPTIDGVVSPGEYDDAAAATTDFRLLRTGPPPSLATEGLAWQAVFDNDALYILITATFTGWDNTATEASDDNLDGFDETVEIFIDPNLDNEPNVAGDTAEDSYQLQIEAIPGSIDIRQAGQPGPPFLATAARTDALFGDETDGGGWNPTQISFARNAGASGGIFEYRIPFAELDATFDGGTDTSMLVGINGPSNGDTWLFNISRISSTGDLPIWNYHVGDGASAFFAEREFGEITFQGKPIPTGATTWSQFE